MELRGLGLIDSRDNCWSFFIERIRRQLKVWDNETLWALNYVSHAVRVKNITWFIQTHCHIAYCKIFLSLSLSSFHLFYLTFHHLLCAPGRLVFLTGGVHTADTCPQVSSSGELHSHWLVSPLASACLAVCQLYVHREDTRPGGNDLKMWLLSQKDANIRISWICVYPYPLQPNVRASISEFISYAHTSVNEVSYCSAL